MIKPITDYLEWSNKYGIQISILECPSCKDNYALNVPIAFKGYRGLEMQAHGICNNLPFRVVPTDLEKIELFNSLK